MKRHRCTLNEMKKIYSYYLSTKNKSLKVIGKELGYSMFNISKAISIGLERKWDLNQNKHKH